MQSRSPEVDPTVRTDIICRLIVKRQTLRQLQVFRRHWIEAYLIIDTNPICDEVHSSPPQALTVTGVSHWFHQ
jgi:hypothetical protein